MEFEIEVLEYSGLFMKLSELLHDRDADIRRSRRIRVRRASPVIRSRINSVMLTSTLLH